LRREGEQRWSSKIMNKQETDQSYTSPLKAGEISKSAKKREKLDESEDQKEGEGNWR
jgi:hypothetical protein